MRLISVLVGILIGTYALLTLVERLWGQGRFDSGLRGRISLALLFVSTGVGHFVKTAEMVEMLLPWVPMRGPFIYATGILEWALAVGLLVPGLARVTGWCVIAFLIAVFPSNVYAAVNRVGMGGHELGPIYLLVRGPLQLLLIGWAWWFAARESA